jgi:hypothetical protein
MALIPIFQVVADEYYVDPNWTTDILAGNFVTLSGGYAVRANGNTDSILGVAGDTQSTSSSVTPYATQLIINGAGQKRWTENRVSDFYNETGASGKITIYTSGGKFATDLYGTMVTTATANSLYVGTTGKLTSSTPGGTANVVAKLVAAPTAWPSGVPGTDVSGSTSLGTYITFVLQI